LDVIQSYRIAIISLNALHIKIPFLFLTLDSLFVAFLEIEFIVRTEEVYI